MKFIHIADLHIGKRLCEHSMIEDQQYILKEIIKVVDLEKPDAVLIAGDVYDKSVPSSDAVEVLDDFLVALSKRETKTFVLSGNHDSAERIAFGGRLMMDSNVYMCPVYTGVFSPVTLQDEHGEVDVWMLPFVRPVTVKAFLGIGDEADAAREKVVDYTSAVQKALSRMKKTPGRRNVLLAHQFVTGASVDEDGSEEFVGGLDNVEAYAFDGFDYVALGHIHRPQNVVKREDGVGRIRYSGTPLKYSLSEVPHRKTVTVVELGASSTGMNNGADMAIREIALCPMREVRKIEGTFAELVSLEYREAQVREGKNLGDYVYVVLTDENDIPDAAAKLRSYYPKLVNLSYDNARTRNSAKVNLKDVKRKSPLEIFAEFFKEMNGREMNEDERDCVAKMIGNLWEGR